MEISTVIVWHTAGLESATFRGLPLIRILIVQRQTLCMHRLTLTACSNSRVSNINDFYIAVFCTNATRCSRVTTGSAIRINSGLFNSNSGLGMNTSTQPISRTTPCCHFRSTDCDRTICIDTDTAITAAHAGIHITCSCFYFCATRNQQVTRSIDSIGICRRSRISSGNRKFTVTFNFQTALSFKTISILGNKCIVANKLDCCTSRERKSI